MFEDTNTHIMMSYMVRNNSIQYRPPTQKTSQEGEKKLPLQEKKKVVGCEG